MKHKTIGQLAKQAKISVRTLHHYDDIGLLKPSVRADNAYRFYSEYDKRRLHDVLFFRALGFSLQEIGQLLDVSEDDRRQLLLTQREQLDEHINRLQAMRIQLQETLTKQEKQNMKSGNKFDVFDGFDPDQYAEEAKTRWGSSNVYKQSAKRTRSYSKQDWARYKSEAEQLTQGMAALMDEGLEADSTQVLALIEKTRLQINHWFYDCSKEMHANLGEMYITDERFRASYEKIRPGLATFVRDAAVANLQNSA